MKGKSSNNPTFFSKTVNVIKNPFFIIGFIFLIAIITYFVISHKQSNPTPPSACDPNTQILCGGICIDKSQYQCVNGKPCSNQNFCPDPSPLANNTCCNPTQTCDKGKCIDCPQGRPICSGECCPEGESCTGPGSQGSCCKTENIINGQCCSTPSTICTSADGKTKSCCNPQSGQTCNTETGVCVAGCPDINNMNAYKCPGDLTPPPIPTKSILCDPNSVCTVDCSQKGDNRFVCQQQGVCDWAPINYQQGLLQYNATTDVLNPDGSPIYQCSDTNSNSWIKENSDPNLYANESVKSMQTDKDKQKLCTIDLCKAKIEEGSTGIIKGDPTLDGNYYCSASIDCSKALLPNNSVGQNLLNNICNVINSSTHYTNIYNNHGRCCKNKNGNTGQVCGYNQFCDDDQNCYTGFTFDSISGRCKPSISNNQTFQDCLKNTQLCASKADQCTEWSNCFCCPKYKNCGNCGYTYKMNPYNYKIAEDFLSSVQSWAYTSGFADHVLYIYVPQSVNFQYTGNPKIYYYDPSTGHGDPQIIQTSPGTLFDDNTVLYVFASSSNCMNFTFNLNDVEYTVNTKSGGNCSTDPPPYCYGNGWCIDIVLNGNHYGVNQSTKNEQKYLGDEINAYAQIGDSGYGGSILPGRIWISAPAPKQSDGTYKYLNWGEQCPASDNPNILPDDHHHKKRNEESKNINLFIFMIFIIIFLLVLYFFRK
jgi:hypothetical protein